MRGRILWPLLAGLLVTVILAAPISLSAATLVLQGIDTEAYPEVRLDIALTADLVPEAGEPSFTVLENGIEATGVRAQVQTEERGPVDVVLLLDESGSMRGEPLEAAKAAARSFIQAMRPADRVAVIAFSSEPRLLTDFTSDPAVLMGAVDALSASGETALYDGLIRAARMFQEGEAARFITVLSDGGDTTSINAIDTAAEAVSGAEATVYAVALESPEYDPTSLGVLASSSGGRLVSVQDAESLATIFEDIAKELRNLYTVVFTSARPSTKDLEIEIRAQNGEVSGSLVTAVENPIYAESALSPSAPVTSAPQNSMLEFAIGALVLFAVGSGVWAAASLLAPKRSALDQLSYYEQGGGPVHASPDSAIADTSRGRVMNAIDYVAERRGFAKLFKTNLERAGMPLRVNEYIFFHLLFTLLVGGLAVLLADSFMIVAILVVVAAAGPLVFVQTRIDRRRAAFEEQLPDVLSLIAGSLRAGWGIQQSISLVVQEVADPSASEFGRVESETRFGLPFEEALRRMAERVDSDDFRWTVAAVAIQREVGGNLAEVLDIVAATIRQRAELRRHVRALTAEGRFSAIVLALLPFLVIVGMVLIAPQYVAVLLTARIGPIILGFGAVLLVVGVIWIIRLTKVEI